MNNKEWRVSVYIQDFIMSSLKLISLCERDKRLVKWLLTTGSGIQIRSGKLMFIRVYCSYLAVSHKIVDMSQSMAHIDDFVMLLNFLDFMETIGYHFKKERLNQKDLEELFGPSLAFNFQIYRLYIEDRRERHNNPNFYTEFELLYNELSM